MSQIANKKRIGAEAVEEKGWLGAHKWLLLRRISQLSILGLFLIGPLAGIWIVKGNLNYSHTLGVLPPTVEPRATGHIPDMVELIERIIRNGHAYVVKDADGNPTGNVYFDVASWPHYGELTHQKQGAVEADEAAAVADRMGPSVDAAMQMPALNSSS